MSSGARERDFIICPFPSKLLCNHGYFLSNESRLFGFWGFKPMFDKLVMVGKVKGAG